MKINRSTATQKVLAGAALGLGLLLSPSASGAMAIIYDVDYHYSGVAISAPTPWLTATFLQTTPWTVELHMKVNNVTAARHVQNWWFNFDGNTADLQIIGTDSIGTTVPTFATPTVNATLYNQNRGGLNWDFSFSMGTSTAFSSGDDVWINFYNAAGLNVNQFNSFTTSPQGNLYTGAWIPGAVVPARITDMGPRFDDGGGPPHFALVPETSTVFLGFLLLAGCIGGEVLRRRREAALEPIPVSAS